MKKTKKKSKTVDPVKRGRAVTKVATKPALLRWAKKIPNAPGLWLSRNLPVSAIRCEYISEIDGVLSVLCIASQDSIYTVAVKNYCKDQETWGGSVRFRYAP